MLKNNANKIVPLLLVALALTGTASLPQPGDDGKVPTSGNPDNTGALDLPFLQFKDGGIRVNFAGFHAAAGLGGLLGGSDAQGGLHVSAGTPWGPSAGAGLGGSLGGGDGSAKGGLYARAGLGNGRPEAAAGLGGSLDGSGRSGSRARGGLFAGATAGGPQAAAGLGGSIDEAGGRSGSSYATASNGLDRKMAAKEVSNIQPIAPPSDGEKVYLAKAGDEDPSTTLQFKLPVGNRKKAIASNLRAGETSNSVMKNEAGAPNAVAFASEVEDVDGAAYPARRYYRKRLRGSPVRKRTFYKYLSTSTEPMEDLPAQSGSSNHPAGITTRQVIDGRPNGYVEAPQRASTKPRTATFFDDIFNIPISTLAAVNQLLNNKSG